MLNRRAFLSLVGGAAATSAVGAGAWAGLLRERVEDAAAVAVGGGSVSGRVLVVLQLDGGNDGLNTLVPSDGRYRDARPKLALPEADLVRVRADGFALHPGLTPLAARWDAGRIAAFEGIGQRNQSRSHFKAMDVWWAGTDGSASTTGWLGRWLDATEGSSPNPLRSISLGTGAPALVGSRSLPTVVLSPSRFALAAPARTDAAAITAAFLATSAPGGAGGDVWLDAARAAIPTTIEAIDLVDRARVDDPDVDLVTGRVNENTASALLQTAAGIIELGVGTQVLLVGVNGFDTHSNQLIVHDELLRDVAAGITAFFDRLEAAGLADNVLLVTTSEFGRRVAENASEGTDHGFAGAQFVMGAGVRGGRVVGDAGLGALVDGDLPIGIDTRSLYAVALDWLGGPTDDVLGGSFDRYGLI